MPVPVLELELELVLVLELEQELVLVQELTAWMLELDPDLELVHALVHDLALCLCLYLVHVLHCLALRLL